MKAGPALVQGKAEAGRCTFCGTNSTNAKP